MIALVLLLGLGAPQEAQAAPPVATLPDVVAAAQAEPLPEGVGLVTLDCTQRRDGRLTNCRIVEETPAGQGFGRAALETAERTRTGPAPRGGRMRFTTRFVPANP